jgi:serine protease Do
MYGVGTAFHIDGFGNFLTAYHVVDFIEKPLAGRPILFLSMHAVVFGTVRIPSDCFVPAHQVFASMMESDDPMAALRGESSRRPAIDVALLVPEPIGPGARPPQTLRLRTSGWSPTAGEVVLAIGFPQLDLSEVDPAKQSALLEEGMFGAYGRIIAVHERGVSRSNPTPVFEVESDWPGGMSGGPVLNRNGEVVGMVSRSLRAEAEHSGSGYAIHFGMARGIELLTPNVDRLNPGWRNGWGVFVETASQPTSVHAAKEEAEAAALLHRGHTEVRHIAHRIGTNDFMYLGA